MITDEMITEAIKNAPKDHHGQTRIVDLQVGRLFPDNKQEVEDHLKTSKKYQLSLYGGTLGTYYAICKRY